MGTVGGLRHGTRILAMSNDDPALEAILNLWHEHLRRKPIPDEDIAGLIRSFFYWLALNGHVVTTSAHKEALARLRADLAGDRTVFIKLSARKDGFNATFFDAPHGRNIGSAILYKRALPSYAEVDELLIASIARPVCSKCGWTDERKDDVRRFWMMHDRGLCLCSDCAQSAASARAKDY